ncbi:hypothetical protein LQW54_002775 [Pestalotiopsis sp. IQ-011]
MGSFSVEIHASNPFRNRILAGEVCAVMSVKVVTSNEIAMMAKMAGIPGMFIDMEHSAKYAPLGASWSLSGGGDQAMLLAGLKALGEEHSGINERVQEARRSS